MTNDFIFELGCEELPSASVWPLADEFASLVLAALDKQKLSYGSVLRFASPRRLALIIRDLQAEQAGQTMLRRGPALAAAYDKDKQPTQALLGFVQSCGVGINDLSIIHTDKGEYVGFEGQQAKVFTSKLLPDLVRHSLSALSIAKPMRWGSSDQEFVRPVHWAVMLYGDTVLEQELYGIKTGRESRGHRFHHPQSIVITSAQDYESQLEAGFVLADFFKRKQLIQNQIHTLAASLKAEAVMPDALLDEVTSIVEWPQALLAHFDESFLEVPPEVLIASMQVHQKCFALKDKQGQLIPYFITVSNIDSKHPEQVILGNEKVMRARLSDAAFFYSQDKKRSLSSYIQATEQVVFQAKLGSVHDKAVRVAHLIQHLSQGLSLPIDLAQRAAQLSKCDLLTGMVGEFPELQGLMGYYYALNDGEESAVAQALNEQYMPRFAADDLPASELGLALSLADRIDTLVGIFSIGLKPSGAKDPFKLRRHALAIVRLLISTPAALSLCDLMNEAVLHYSGRIVENKQHLIDLKSFILDRLSSHYQNQGIGADLILAVRARQEDWLYDFDSRLKALRSFLVMPEAASLAAACKRVTNLLNNASMLGTSLCVNEALIEAGPEQVLYNEMNQVAKTIAPLYDSLDYGAVLQHLARLKSPVDNFFDQVMVMVKEEELRTNRLALLAQLHVLLRGVADISICS